MTILGSAPAAIDLTTRSRLMTPRIRPSSPRTGTDSARSSRIRRPACCNVSCSPTHARPVRVPPAAATTSLSRRPRRAARPASSSPGYWLYPSWPGCEDAESNLRNACEAARGLAHCPGGTPASRLRGLVRNPAPQDMCIVTSAAGSRASTLAGRSLAAATATAPIPAR